jgi:hypothetical protein
MRGDPNDKDPENDADNSASKCCVLSRAFDILLDVDGKRATFAESSG